MANSETTTNKVSAVPIYPITPLVRNAADDTSITSKKLVLYCMLSDGFSLNIFFNADVLV